MGFSTERILQFMEPDRGGSYAHPTSDHHGYFGRHEVKFDGVFGVEQGRMLSKHLTTTLEAVYGRSNSRRLSRIWPELSERVWHVETDDEVITPNLYDWLKIDDGWAVESRKHVSGCSIEIKLP